MNFMRNGGSFYGTKQVQKRAFHGMVTNLFSYGIALCVFVLCEFCTVVLFSVYLRVPKLLVCTRDD